MYKITYTKRPNIFNPKFTHTITIDAIDYSENDKLIFAKITEYCEKAIDKDDVINIEKIVDTKQLIKDFIEDKFLTTDNINLQEEIEKDYEDLIDLLDRIKENAFGYEEDEQTINHVLDYLELLIDILKIKGY